MTTAERERTRVVAVRPHPYLFQQWTIAILLLMAPIFGVLYWLTLPDGAWVPVFATQVVLTLVFALCVISYYLTTIWVDHTGVTKRDAFGRVITLPAERIGSVIRLELARSGSLDLLPQLFVVDRDGALFTRMHGVWWPREAMEKVIDELGAPVERLPEPVTLVELGRARPELLHWFERRVTTRTVAD
jgi:hypothetical protein